MQHLQLNNIRRAILATIIYSDIFDYPLSFDEIILYLIKEFSIKSKIQKELNVLLKEKLVYKSENYYCLKNRNKIILLRKKREKISAAKIIQAEKVIHILGFIPTIQLIGLSGSLAVKNAKETDDIDLFIITKKDSIWVTRICILTLLQLFGKRRKRQGANAKNTICANMFIDEKNLQLPKIKQNIYTAHEVMQMKPVFTRKNVYIRFLKENSWIKKYLPNMQFQIDKENSHSFVDIVGIALSALEIPAKATQLFYMQKHRTKEIITQFLLAFHPHDKQEVVLKEFQKRKRMYAI